MCTAITYQPNNFYFGRTLDYDRNFGEEVTITPRNFPLRFRTTGVISNHYAFIGMAHVAQNYPLYYEAMNEKGLCMAGLNFIGNASYHNFSEDKDNIAPFEFIPWILSQCSTLLEAKSLLEKLNLIHLPFNNELSIAGLHWILSDSTGSLTIESVAEGLKIYDNPVGVLTNNPSFPEQLFHLNNYMSLSPYEPENHFSQKLSFQTYSRGMGAIGLPGDFSSQSRFVRASFVKWNSIAVKDEHTAVNQFFHIINNVEQTKGCCRLSNGRHEMTLYTCCCSASKGIYYYTTYGNHQISAINMFSEPLDDACLIRYPLISSEKISFQNI